MISKVVQADSFYHTCRYIISKQGAEVLLSDGVRDHSYKLMADDFEAQRSLRPSKGQACFHGILSFYPGENPPNELMKEIAERYLKELGIVDTQVAVCKHTDRAHLHLHIVANMINKEGKVIKDNWIGLRGKKIAQKLTKEYNLIPALQKNLNLTHLEVLSEMETAKYKIYIAVSEALPTLNTLEGLEKSLQKQGIEIQYKLKSGTDQRQGISFKLGDYCFKGSSVDRKFSLIGLQKMLNENLRQMRRQPLRSEQTGEANGNNPPNSRIENIFIPKEKLKENLQSRNNNLQNTLDILLKPEQEAEGLPYHLSSRADERKRKKRAQKPK